MAVGGEIKSVLTLDVTKFTAAIDRATANLESLDKQLKSAKGVTDGFEKSITGLAADVTGAADKFKTLDASLSGLTSKLNEVANSGFGNVSSSSKRAKDGVDGITKSNERLGAGMLSMSTWTKQYGTALESLKPSLQNVIAGQQALTRANEQATSVANKSAADQIRVKIKTLENEKVTNAQLIIEKQKLATELAAIETRIRNEAFGKRVAADQIEKRVGAYGGKAGIADQIGQATRLDSNADWIKRQTEETTRQSQAIRDKNVAIADSIVGLKRDAAQAESNAVAEKAALAASTQALSEKITATKIATKEETRIKREEKEMWSEVEKGQRQQSLADARAKAKEALAIVKQTKADAKAAEQTSNEERKALARVALEETRAEAREKLSVMRATAKELADINKSMKAEQKALDAEEAAEAKALKNLKIQAEKDVASAAKVASQDSVKFARDAAMQRKQLATDVANHEKEQAQQISQMWKGMGQLWGAAKIEKGLAASVGAADKTERGQVALSTLNYSPEHNQQINADAAKMSADLGFISTLDAVKSRMSAIASIGEDNAEVIGKTLTNAVKAANNLEYMGFGHGDMQSSIRNMYGVVEMRQQTHDADKSNQTFELLQKIVTGTQGKVQVTDMESLLRRLGAGSSQLSDAGMVALAAIVDQFKIAGGEGGGGGGAQVVGTSIKMMQAYALGKGKSNTAVAEFAGAGILDTGGLDLTQDKGNILKQAKNGNFKDADLWLSNPVAAIQKIMPDILAYTQKPENVKKFYQGKDTKDDSAQLGAITQYLMRLGITQTAISAMLVAGDPRSKERIDKQVGTIGSSKGISEVDIEAQKTYGRITQDTSVAITNLAAMVGKNLLPVVESVLKAVTSIANAFVGFGASNPLTLQFLTIVTAGAGVILALKGISSMFGMVGMSITSFAQSVGEKFGLMTSASKAAALENMNVLKTTVAATAAAELNAVANLKQAQTQVRGAVTSAELAAANAVLAGSHMEVAAAQKASAVAATNLNTAQKAASVSGKLAAGAWALIGGPIGLIVIALTAAAVAWDEFGNKAEKNAKRIEDAASRAKAAADGISTAASQKQNKEDIAANKDDLASAIDRKNRYLAINKTTTGKASTEPSDIAMVAALNDEIARLKEEGKKLDDVKVATEVNMAKNAIAAAAVAADLAARAKRQKEIEKGVAVGAAANKADPKAPKTPEELIAEAIKKTNATADATVVASTVPNPKHLRIFEDAFTKTFANIQARAEETRLKIKALADGEGTYEQQAKALTVAQLVGGQFDKDNDPTNRAFIKKGYNFSKGAYRDKAGTVVDSAVAIDVDGKYLDGKLVTDPSNNNYSNSKASQKKKESDEAAYAAARSITDLIEERRLILEGTDELKALSFAKASNTAISEEASVAAENNALGLNKETDAIRALRREYARKEGDNAKANQMSGQAGNYSTDKLGAFSSRAGLDLSNYSTATKSATKDINSKLALDDSGKMKEDADKLRSQFEQTNDKAAIEFNTLQATAQKSYDDLVKIGEGGSKAALQVLTAQRTAQTDYTEFVKARAKEQQEALLTPVQKLGLEWGKTYSTIQNMQVGWANNFESMLEKTLDTGKMDFRGFAASIVKDLRTVFIKDQIAKPLSDAMGSIGGAASKVLFNQGADGKSMGPNDSMTMWTNLKGVVSGAADSLKGFWGNITGSTTDLAKNAAQNALNLTGEVTKLTAEQAATASILALGNAAAVASMSMGGSAGGLGGLFGGLFGGGGDIAAGAQSSGAFTAGIANPSIVSTALLPLANGGLITKFGPVSLRQYANGGIANTPQVSLFGEAGPEAYVPLPDGRSIPVTMSGTAGAAPGNNVTIQINVSNAGSTTSDKTTSGDDAGAWTQLADKVKAVVRNELITNQRPGGLLYK